MQIPQSISKLKPAKLNDSGYTVVELLVVLIIFATLGISFMYIGRQNLSDARDIERKRDLNALYFALEASKQRGEAYPQYPSTDNLKGIDPEILVDPKGVKLGDPGAEYRYEPASCTDQKCQTFELKVNLEKEAEFTKKSSN